MHIGKPFDCHCACKFAVDLNYKDEPEPNETRRACVAASNIEYSACGTESPTREGVIMPIPNL